MNRPLCLIALLATGMAATADATTLVRFLPAANPLAVGQETTLEIVADFDEPVVGFGLDLVLAGTSVVTLDDLAVGPAWTPVPAPDGDGFAGLAPVTGYVGNGVVLATVTLQALLSGATTIGAAITPGDLTEGFALLGSGFDDVLFEPAILQVLPEPGSGLFVAIGVGMALALARLPVPRDRAQ